MTQLFRPRPSTRGYADIDLSTAADGQSDSINLSGLVLSCIATSTAWTAANIGFMASVGGSTFYHVYDSAGNFLTYPASASRVIAIDPAVFSGIQLLKLVSETSAGVAVAQGAARVLKLGLSEYVG